MNDIIIIQNDSVKRGKRGSKETQIRTFIENWVKTMRPKDMEGAIS